MTAMIDKSRIAESFSRAASSYDSVAELQREVGAELLERLPNFSANRVMDLGSGTGWFTGQLAECYPSSRLISLDLAFGMLQYSRAQRPSPRCDWLCADAEQLPLKDQSISLIYSSLAVQWCERPELLMSEIDRVLEPGGYCLLATLGPDTLVELRNAWAAVDQYVHVNRFISAEQLLSGKPGSLQLESLTESVKTLQYPRLRDLTDELKKLGAHNMNAGQQTGLTSRQRVRLFSQAYEEMRLENGMLPASYQVYFIVLQKAEG